MTVRYNAALIRYQGGHVYLDRSGSARPRERYIEMGGVTDREVAIVIGDKILALYAAERVTVGQQGEVRTSVQIPTVGYTLGDTIAGNMIRSYTVTLTGNGTAQVVPELDDRLERREEALNRQLQRAGTGMRSEYAKPNITAQDTGQGTDSEPSEFSLSGPIVPSFSEAWRAGRGWWCAWLDVGLVTPGSSSTRVQILREVGATWVPAATCTIAAGATRGLAVVNQGWQVGQRLVVAVAIAGGGAQDLTATLRGTMV